MSGNSIHKDDFWLRLDNAAKIYPAIKDNELTSVFRVGVELKERIKVRQFIEAIHSLEKRFPYYKVKLKAGFFWYYLEPENLAIATEPDHGIPCRAFEKHELMFRVLAREKQMSVEFSHILTDGTGAFEFLKTLLLSYFEKCGSQPSPAVEYLRPDELPDPAEYEDAYSRYFKKIRAKPLKISRAFHIPFRLRQRPRFDIITAIMPLDIIMQKAKGYQVSLTEYLIAVYLYSLQHVFEKQTALKKITAHKIARIEVPVNLRRMFPSKTMRNFSLYVIPGIDMRLGHYNFEEIVKTVYHQMQLETDKKLISKMISRNVSGEKNSFVKALPLFIKSLFLSKLYSLGTGQYSGVVTNLGKIDLSPAINDQIEQFIFIPPPPNKILKINCGVVGFANKLMLTFGNITASRELERQFFTFLVSQNVPVKLINTK